MQVCIQATWHLMHKFDILHLPAPTMAMKQVAKTLCWMVTKRRCFLNTSIPLDTLLVDSMLWMFHLYQTNIKF